MQNDDIQLPERLKQEIKSKPKLSKLTFTNKLDLLIDWAGDDENKKIFLGLKKIDDLSYNVNISTLSKHFKVKDRSLAKNFTLSHFQRKAYQSSKDWVIFTQKKDINSVVKTCINLGKELDEDNLKDWNASMVYDWDQFIEHYPNKRVSDFALQFGKNNAILSTSDLISYTIKSEIFDAKSFQNIYLHFGPTQGMQNKISAFFSAIFSRDWCIGEGKRTVSILPPNKFLFDDGFTQITLLNDKSCKNGGIWLILDDQHKYETETFFEEYYPKELPTNEKFIYSIMKHFPSSKTQNLNDDNDSLESSNSMEEEVVEILNSS